MSATRSYHGQPITKAPTWTWQIPNYLFSGGLAGASAGLAYGCQLRGEDVLARRAWAAALAGIGVSPLLLISELGRPDRFFNMLRVFKVTSPMSVGSWILVVSSTTTTLAAAGAWIDMLPRAARHALLPGVARIAAPTAALFGLPLSTYTAALLVTTSVPAWHEARTTLPFVFGAGAAVSAGGAALVLTPLRHAGPARRLALAAAPVELALTELMERRLGEQGEAYRRGAARVFGRLARGSLAAGSVLLAARGRRSSPASIVAGGLLMAGALSTRWSVFKAGFESVADPAFAVGSQRDRIASGGDHGARRTQTVGAPDPMLGTPALPSRSPLHDLDARPAARDGAPER